MTGPASDASPPGSRGLNTSQYLGHNAIVLVLASRAGGPDADTGICINIVLASRTDMYVLNCTISGFESGENGILVCRPLAVEAI